MLPPGEYIGRNTAAIS